MGFLRPARNDACASLTRRSNSPRKTCTLLSVPWGAPRSETTSEFCHALQNMSRGTRTKKSTLGSRWLGWANTSLNAAGVMHFHVRDMLGDTEHICLSDPSDTPTSD